jgi:hypothetical protein
VETTVTTERSGNTLELSRILRARVDVAVNNVISVLSPVGAVGSDCAATYTIIQHSFFWSGFFGTLTAVN